MAKKIKYIVLNKKFQKANVTKVIDVLKFYAGLEGVDNEPAKEALKVLGVK